ncbi:MAG: hypothetical protein HZC48_07060 [Nitrospirae bacterium]|nr:hypothetical protein [Nitrospirota bacterium]
MMIKSVTRHINVLNLFLLGAIYISANSYLLPALGEKTALPQTAQKIGTPQHTISAGDRFQSPPATEYLIVSDQSLFHPERKIPAETKDTQLTVKPEFVLYGTLITDTAAIAYMEERNAPYSSPGRGKRQQTVLLGKSLNNYTLAEIHHDRVFMVRGEDRIEVKISDTQPSRGQIAQVTIAPAIEETKDLNSILEEKPAGSGLPPGVIIKEMPPELRDKVPPQLKDMFHDLIKKQTVPQ